MNKVKHFKIIYKQEFMGEILTDSYDKWCTSNELEYAISALYDDPHVFSVSYIEITVEN